jgi:hypothetical protein
MTQAQLKRVLSDAYAYHFDALTRWEREFAASLLARKSGRLSEKQRPIVERIVEKVSQGKGEEDVLIEA